MYPRLIYTRVGFTAVPFNAGSADEFREIVVREKARKGGRERAKEREKKRKTE